MSEDVDYGKQVLRLEAEAISALEAMLDKRFAEAVALVLACKGQTVTTGMGKSGLIAQKISATLASTGTPSFFLHPAEALHGDLGRVGKSDLVLALSNSGQSEEIRRLIPGIKRLGAKLISVTANEDSSLARHADCLLLTAAVSEACPLQLAPTTSTTAQLALGDALAMTVAKRRNFTREEYALYHPAGELGRSLLRVRELMSDKSQAPPAPTGTITRAALVEAGGMGRRPGMLPVVGPKGTLRGILTDGDVRRHVLRDTSFVDRPIDEVMTKDPLVARPEQLAADAWHVMKKHNFDELPVVDEHGLYVGLLDIQAFLEAGFQERK